MYPIQNVYDYERYVDFSIGLSSNIDIISIKNMFFANWKCPYEMINSCNMHKFVKICLLLLLLTFAHTKIIVDSFIIHEWHLQSHQIDYFIEVANIFPHIYKYTYTRMKKYNHQLFSRPFSLHLGPNCLKTNRTLRKTVMHECNSVELLPLIALKFIHFGV